MWHELPMVQGWSYLSAGIESDPALMVKRKGQGYIAQEISRLMAIAKESYGR